MSTERLGDRIAVGRTSDVHAYGTDSVVKIPHADVPDEWPRFEAAISSSVHGAGLPAPEVRDVVDIGGRTAVVFERIYGPSMWQAMVDNPDRVAPLAHQLASIQRNLFSSSIPAGLPDFLDRLVRRIQLAPDLDDAEIDEAVDLARSLPRGVALLHGDLHPGNVLMGAKGPVVIDWFDAAIGHPIADVVRSSILIRPGSSAAPGHLPGADAATLGIVHDTYVSDFGAELEAEDDDLRTWQAVIATGRLSEGAEPDGGRLLRLWNERNGDVPASLTPREEST